MALSSLLALAGQFVVYPGSKPAPPLSGKTSNTGQPVDSYVTQDPYDKVVAFYIKSGKEERTTDIGGRRTFFSLDQGVEVVVWEVNDHVVSITVKKKK